MYFKSKEIKTSHVKKESGVLGLDLKDDSGHARLCYYPNEMKVKWICDDLKKAMK